MALPEGVVLLGGELSPKTMPGNVGQTNRGKDPALYRCPPPGVGNAV
jgi:hypothetical protein